MTITPNFPGLDREADLLGDLDFLGELPSATEHAGAAAAAATEASE